MIYLSKTISHALKSDKQALYTTSEKGSEILKKCNNDKQDVVPASSSENSN